MARDRSDLTRARRSNVLRLSQHRIDEVSHVVGGGVRLVEVLEVVEMHLSGLFRERLRSPDELRL